MIYLYIVHQKQFFKSNFFISVAGIFRFVSLEKFEREGKSELQQRKQVTTRFDKVG